MHNVQRLADGTWFVTYSGTAGHPPSKDEVVSWTVIGEENRIEAVFPSWGEPPRVFHLWMALLNVLKWVFFTASWGASVAFLYYIVHT